MCIRDRKQCQWQKQEPLARVIFNLTNYNDFNDFFNVELIDRICKQIYQSKRIIMYGAMGLLNLTPVSYTHLFF